MGIYTLMIGPKWSRDKCA